MTAVPFACDGPGGRPMGFPIPEERVFDFGKVVQHRHTPTGARRSPVVSSPWPIATDTAWACVRTPSLLNTRILWFSTVFSATPRWRAIALPLIPSAIATSTSRSRGVSAARGTKPDAPCASRSNRHCSRIVSAGRIEDAAPDATACGVGELLKRDVAKQVPGHAALEQPRESLGRWVIRNDDHAAPSREDGVKNRVELIRSERPRSKRNIWELAPTEGDKFVGIRGLAHDVDTFTRTRPPLQATREQVVLSEHNAGRGRHRSAI